jgi:hypothetical protein
MNVYELIRTMLYDLTLYIFHINILRGKRLLWPEGVHRKYLRNSGKRVSKYAASLADATNHRKMSHTWIVSITFPINNRFGLVDIGQGYRLHHPCDFLSETYTK